MITRGLLLDSEARELVRSLDMTDHPRVIATTNRFRAQARAEDGSDPVGLVLAALGSYALRCAQREREEQRRGRVSSVSEAGAVVARAMREIGSLDVDDMHRLDSMCETDLRRLAVLVQQRIERTTKRER